LLDRLDALGRRAAIVGSHGHGKSTLLAELGRRLAARGFTVRRATVRRPARRLDAAQERHLFADLGAGDWLLVDGAGALSALASRSVGRRSLPAAGLVVTRHRPGGGLPTLLECRTSPRLLAQLIAQLAPGLELPPNLSPDALHRRHGGDLRAALLELYDACAGR
jgi:hypothetical protein